MTETSGPLRAPAFHSLASDARPREVSTVVWLSGIVVLSAVLRFAFVATVPGPGIFPDELIYSELARSVGSSGNFLVRDVPFSAWTFSPLYVLLVTPAFLVGSLADAYLLAKAINCIVMSFAAVPAYLLALRVVERRLALVAASFALLLPAMAFSSRVMTESAFYPVFLLVVLAVVRVLETPTQGRQLVALGLIAVTAGFRMQALVLLPALLTSICLRIAMDARQAGRFSAQSLFQRAKAYNTTAFVLGCAALAAAGTALRRGSPIAAISDRADYVMGRISPLDGPKWFIYHVAELDLALGVIPFGAALLFAAFALGNVRASRGAQAFTIAAITASLWTIALAAAFATQADVARVQERYVFYVEPLVIIAFLGWIHARTNGPARRSRFAIACLCVAAVLPLVLPYGTLLNYHAFASAPGLVPWLLVSSGGGLDLAVITIGAFGFAAVIALAKLRHGRSLIAATAAFLAAGTLLVNAAFQTISTRSLSFGLGSGDNRTWIDDAVESRASVAVLWSASGRPWKRFRRVWESEFFNRSVGPVFYLRTPLAYDLPQTRVRLAGSALIGPDGERLHAEYVLSDGPVVAGDKIASRPGVDLTLYRVDGVVRVLSLTDGRRLR